MVPSTNASEYIARLVAEAPTFTQAQSSIIAAALSEHLPVTDAERAA